MTSLDFPTDVLDESVGSSISLVISSDTEPEISLAIIPADIHVILAEIPAILHVALEVEVAVVASLVEVLDLSIHSASETNPSDDPPSPEHTLLAYATVTPDGMPTAPIRETFTRVTATTPTPYLTDGCNRVTARKRFSHPLPAIQPSSYPFVSSSSSSSGSSHSSSFDTSHTPSGILPRKRQQSHPSGPLSSTRAYLLPPHKRFRGTSTASHYEASMDDSIEANVEVDVEADAKTDSEADSETDVKAYTKPLIDTDIEADDAADVEANIGADIEPTIKAETNAEDSVGDTIDIVIDVVIVPVTPDDLFASTVAKQLDEYEETMQGMYEHLLEMLIQRLEDIKEEQRAQDTRAVTTYTERANLRERVRTLEASHTRL
nr:hypothetical protein [Tanacetum cinerariifolium]